MVSWEPTVPAGVGPSGHKHRGLDMGGKLSKNTQIFAFQALFQVLGNADKAAVWAMQARGGDPPGFFGAGFQWSNSFG